MKYRISYSCLSHIGNCRKTNQDCFLCASNCIYSGAKGNETEEIHGSINASENHIFGVFDGMGGEECGEIASYLAAEAASKFIMNGLPQEILKTICDKANTEIYEYALTNSIGTMGTTAALLLFAKKEICLCNVGDSKIFRCSKGSLVQISQDHVYSLSIKGKPPLTQYLGIPPSEMEVHPYFSIGSYQEGDIYLICSDGLTDMVSTERIADILASRPFINAANDLLSEALTNGGRDNITIIVCKIIREHNCIQNLFTKKELE